MQAIDQRPLRLILLLGLPLFLLPKINLITPFGTNAGLRIDDLVLFALGGMILFGRLFSPTPLVREERIALLITLSGALSLSLNLLFLHFGVTQLEANPLFLLRFVEYFTFFYIGWVASRALSIEPLLWLLIGVNALVILLQWRGWVGAFGVYGYSPSIDRRPSGLFGNAAECALVLNSAIAYLLFGCPERGVLLTVRGRALRLPLNPLLVALNFFLILLTGARIALLAFAFLVLCRYWRRLTFWLGLLLVVLLLSQMELSILKRSGQLFSTENLELIPKLYRAVDVENQDYFDASAVRLVDRQCDMSWWMRLHKWVYMSKYYLHRPLCWLFGLGPGVCWNALDGGYLRLLTENGLVGLLLYLWFFLSIGLRSPGLRWVVVVFMLNILFIDSYLSYKPMALLLCLAGYHCLKLEGREDVLVVE